MNSKYVVQSLLGLIPITKYIFHLTVQNDAAKDRVWYGKHQEVNNHQKTSSIVGFCYN